MKITRCEVKHIIRSVFEIFQNKYLITSLLLACISVGLNGQNGVSSKPNVLFIMVDDLRPELGCYGEDHIYSPNIDRLAKMGQSFTRAYVNYPVCGPSRASILSGLYPSRDRFNGWNCSQDADVPGIVSLPMHFRNNNYVTISLGKVYNNFGDGKGSWVENWRPSNTTTDWDYQSKEGIEIYENANRWRADDVRPRNNHNLPNRGVAYERPEVSDIVYMDGRIASKAIEKLQELQNNSHPFFMTVGFKKPHLPFNAPNKYWVIYDSLDIKVPDNMYKPRGAPKESMHNFSELRSYQDIPNEGPFSDSLSKTLIQGYYASVSYTDSQVGRVLDALEELGMEKNTIIVLWGDHGWQLGEHNLWCKHSNFQTSLRIPLIVKTPHSEKGIVNESIVESVDLYPTLCELAGLSLPFHVQGNSFFNVLNTVSTGDKEYAYCRSNLNGETIVSKEYSYTEFYREGEVVSKMLFNLKSDPDENVNVVAEKENVKVVNKLSQLLNQHIENRDKVSLR